MTISEFENGVRKPRPNNVAAIRRALAAAGIVFAVDGSPTLVRSKDQTDGREADNRKLGAAGREKEPGNVICRAAGLPWSIMPPGIMQAVLSAGVMLASAIRCHGRECRFRLWSA